MNSQRVKPRTFFSGYSEFFSNNKMLIVQDHSLYSTAPGSRYHHDMFEHVTSRTPLLSYLTYLSFLPWYASVAKFRHTGTYYSSAVKMCFAKRLLGRGMVLLLKGFLINVIYQIVYKLSTPEYVWAVAQKSSQPEQIYRGYLEILPELVPLATATAVGMCFAAISLYIASYALDKWRLYRAKKNMQKKYNNQHLQEIEMTEQKQVAGNGKSTNKRTRPTREEILERKINMARERGARVIKVNSPLGSIMFNVLRQFDQAYASFKGKLGEPGGISHEDGSRMMARDITVEFSDLTRDLSKKIGFRYYTPEELKAVQVESPTGEESSENESYQVD